MFPGPFSMVILLAGKLDACVAGFFLAVHVELLTVMVSMLMQRIER